LRSPPYQCRFPPQKRDPKGEPVSLVRRAAAVLFRALAGTVMLVVVLGAVLWVRSEWHSRQLERVVAVTREWPKRSIGSDGIGLVDVRTRCSEARLYYLVTISRPEPDLKATFMADPDFAAADDTIRHGYLTKDPAYAALSPQDRAAFLAYLRSGNQKQPTNLRRVAITKRRWEEQTRNALEKITLRFLDKDGFLLTSVDLDLAGFTNQFGSDGVVEQVEANGSTSCDRAAFARAERLDVVWFNRRAR